MPNRSANLQRWMNFIEKHDEALLADMLAEDVVFHSPVVHTPQRGKKITFLYLASAEKVLGGENFAYVRELDCGDQAMIEFVSEIDGIHINGVDIITWNNEGKIIDFKVMVRPLQAVNAIHAAMGRKLEQMKPKP